MSEKLIPRFSIVKAIQVVGDAWSIRILSSMFRGDRRFAELQDALGVSRSALTTRLDQMVEHGLLLRVALNGKRRYEYRLDEAGLDLWEVLLAIREWGLTWYPDDQHVRPLTYHVECQEFIRPVLSCSSCTGPITPFNTFAKPGPGAGFEVRPTGVARRRGSVATRGATSKGAGDRTMLVFGDRWTPAIIATAFRGIRRFNEMESYLRIPPVVLASRLTELVELEIFYRKPVAEGQSTEEFRLTRKGLDIFPYISMLAKWGDKWMTDPPGVPLTFHHKDCGCQYTPVFRCNCCNKPLMRSRVRLYYNMDEARADGAAPKSAGGASEGGVRGLSIDPQMSAGAPPK